jgi:dTDP-4-dehydrorhamnose reductase
MKILGTGLTGLVGSRIVEVLKDKIEFEKSQVDITDEASIKQTIESSDAQVVLHLAAKANVDGCEEDKEKGEGGEAWRINVLGTKYIAKACSGSGKKLVYISTDFVFDGQEEHYDEESKPNPLNWYGTTKLEGEKAIGQISDLDFVIARIAYPYRSHFQRNDFARAIIERLSKKEKIIGITDHIFTPTFVDDIAKALFFLLEQNQTGIFHVVGSEWLTPYGAALTIADIFGFDPSLVEKTTREEFFKNRAKRPFRLSLRNDKIKKLGVKMSTFDEGLSALKVQL